MTGFMLDQVDRKRVLEAGLKRSRDAARPELGPEALLWCTERIAGALVRVAEHLSMIRDRLGAMGDAAPRQADATRRPAERITLKLEEVAALVGVTREALLRAIKRGEFPAVRIGRTWLVPVLAIEAWAQRISRSTRRRP